jgi:hypothetical protein
MVPIWTPPGTPIVISVISTLSPEDPPKWAKASAGDYWRYLFFIAETEIITGVDNHQILDRKKVDESRVPSHMRPLVMPALCKATRVLIRSVQPLLGWGVTEETQPSDQELKKYRLVINSLEKEGYKVAREEQAPEGNQFWIMRRGPR